MSRSFTEAKPSEDLELKLVSLDSRLKCVSLQFKSESRTIIVGPNGAGKSTLLKLLAGLEEPSHGHIFLGSEKLKKFSIAERAEKIAWLPQRAQLDPQLEAIELLNTARFRFYRSNNKPQRDVTYYLEAMQIGKASHRRVGQLSGGELQRVLLACLLAQEAPILLVDEPGNHLDPQGQLLSYRLLSEISQAEKKTLIIASHNIRLAEALEVMSPGQTRVVGLEAGVVQFNKAWTDGRLSSCLEEIYGVPFFDQNSDAPYAVDFQTALREAISDSPANSGSH